VVLQKYEKCCGQPILLHLMTEFFTEPRRTMLLNFTVDHTSQRTEHLGALSAPLSFVPHFPPNFNSPVNFIPGSNRVLWLRFSLSFPGQEVQSHVIRHTHYMNMLICHNYNSTY